MTSSQMLHRLITHVSQSNKWYLVEMEWTLDHKLGLGSLHSHNLYLRGGHHPPPYNILCAFQWDYIQKSFFHKNGNPKVRTILVLNFGGVISLLFQSYFKCVTTLSCSSCWELTKAMLCILIEGHLIPIFHFCGWELHYQFDSQPFFWT